MLVHLDIVVRTIFIKIMIEISTLNSPFVFSLRHLVFCVSCNDQQVAPSGYLRNTIFKPWREIAMGLMPRFVAFCPVPLYISDNKERNILC